MAAPSSGDSDDPDIDTGGSGSDGESDSQEYMHFVSGDVTSPVQSSAIILHCVDSSGDWGSGGVFTALSRKTTEPEVHYSLAGDMGDVREGDVHLVSCENVVGYDDYYVALLVAQDKNLRLKQSLLTKCLEKVSSASKKLGKVSVHLPRIGYNTQGFDWYSTERQLRKYLSNKKIPTYIYYYKRQPQTVIRKRRNSSSEEDNTVSKRAAPGPSSALDVSSVIEDIFTNKSFVIDPSVSGTDERKKLRRYIIAFNGDVESTVSEKTDYVVTIGETSGGDSPTVSQSHAAVGQAFVYDSICYGRVLSSNNYLV